MAETTMDIEFHYCDIKLDPYKGYENSTSLDLIKAIFNNLQADARTSKHHVIDRRAGQEGADKRRLVVIGVVNKPYRRYGKLALIKNKAPYFMSEEFDLDAIENETNKDYVEVTNFYVDTSGKKPIMMVEFNSDGPRISDVEYYLRHIGKTYNLSKYCTISLHVKGEIEEIARNLKNVFRIDLKVRAEKSIYYKDIDDAYYSSIESLKKSYPYQDIRLDVGFGYNKKIASDNYEPNISGLRLGRKLMDFLKKDTENIEHIEGLKMKVDMGDGPELIDFIKNKENSLLTIDLVSKDRPNQKDLRQKASAAFDEYIENTKTK